jgi:hypothetical protein
MTRIMCSAVLGFEAVLMLLAILVLNGFSTLAAPLAGWVGGGMAVACVVAAGSLGRPWGYGLGHAVQVGIVGLGLLALPIAFVGLMFAALWVVAYVVGVRIDRERAIRTRGTR